MPVIILLCFSESSKEQFASTNIAEELVRLFQKQIEHEKKEMIFEVLAPLAENGNVLFFLVDFFWGGRTGKPCSATSPIHHG